MEQAAKELQAIHDKAVELVDGWFPNLKEGNQRDYRIMVTATMNNLLKLMELSQPRY